MRQHSADEHIVVLLIVMGYATCFASNIPFPPASSWQACTRTQELRVVTKKMPVDGGSGFLVYSIDVVSCWSS